MKQNITAKNWHKTRVVPQVADTDYGGGIYHGRYFNLYNIARDIFLEDIGVPYRSLMDQEINLSVAQVHTRYYKSVFYGDRLIVHTRVVWIRTRSFAVEQKMVCTDPDSGQDVLKNEMTMNLVCTGRSGAVTIPERLKRAMLEFHE